MIPIIAPYALLDIEPFADQLKISAKGEVEYHEWSLPSTSTPPQYLPIQHIEGRRYIAVTQEMYRRLQASTTAGYGSPPPTAWFTQRLPGTPYRRVPRVMPLAMSGPEHASDELDRVFGEELDGLRQTMVKTAAAYYKRAHDQVLTIERNLRCLNKQGPRYTFPLQLTPPAQSPTPPMMQLSLRDFTIDISLSAIGMLTGADPDTRSIAIPEEIRGAPITPRTLTHYVTWAHGLPIQLSSPQEVIELFHLADFLSNTELTQALGPVYQQVDVQLSPLPQLPTPAEVEEELKSVPLEQITPILNGYLQQVRSAACETQRSFQLPARLPTKARPF
jgi:hypothetical protein